MAQPELFDLLGEGTTYDIDSSKLMIIDSAFVNQLLPSLSEADAVTILAAIIKRSHRWLSTNTDESVLATSSLSISTPSTRNNLEKTLFSYTIEFYGNYQSPDFNPNDV